ncbi:MAG TPA: hypothetical protein VGF28_24550 [Thermoanaerobaculia bacterium]|jgi:hypothetical protein
MQRNELPIDRGTAWVCALLSCAIASYALYEWQASHKQPAAAELQTIEGVVGKVTHKGRSAAVTSIHFELGGSADRLVYGSFLPSFDEALDCIEPDARVRVRVLPKRRPQIWELRCEERTLADPSAIYAARRANGRAGGWVSVAFFCAAGFFVWALITGRAT